jgi:hypothetical protein
VSKTRDIRHKQIAQMVRARLAWRLSRLCQLVIVREPGVLGACCAPRSRPADQAPVSLHTSRRFSPELARLRSDRTRAQWRRGRMF